MECGTCLCHGIRLETRFSSRCLKGFVIAIMHGCTAAIGGVISSTGLLLLAEQAQNSTVCQSCSDSTGGREGGRLAEWHDCFAS